MAAAVQTNLTVAFTHGTQLTKDHCRALIHTLYCGQGPGCLRKSVCVCVCVCERERERLCVYLYVCMHMFMHMCVCMHVCICLYVFVCVCVCVCVFMDVCVAFVCDEVMTAPPTDLDLASAGEPSAVGMSQTDGV